MSLVPTIAIVDDDQAMREALDDMVKSCGYESRLFSSAEEFLSLEQRDSIVCLLLDVKMPGLSGLELQALLNTEPSKPPIIFMTSYHDERTRSAAMEGGALAFLGKPVEFDCLIAALEKALDKG
ncbi:response regulator transcription factor [Neorhizobium galegae]|uniref:Response regulator n=1 Tax=Neorhizobium galegae bv. officinalis TaxID=323656 RepID=A0A0T7GPQ0_NEOGA|nr:response regulator [Neorhizobium galegae]CDZ49241.1 Response regulator [Neorhizobium galegae bv. officinalis]